MSSFLVRFGQVFCFMSHCGLYLSTRYVSLLFSIAVSGVLQPSLNFELCKTQTNRLETILPSTLCLSIEPLNWKEFSTVQKIY